MVVKVCGKGCGLRLFLAKKELGANLFRCGYGVRGWRLWRGIAGRREVGGWFACGKTWGLEWACGRKRVFKFRQHNRFFSLLHSRQVQSSSLSSVQLAAFTHHNYDRKELGESLF